MLIALFAAMLAAHDWDDEPGWHADEGWSLLAASDRAGALMAVNNTERAGNAVEFETLLVSRIPDEHANTKDMVIIWPIVQR